MVALPKPDNRILDTIIQGDCLSVLRSLADNSVDACVVDPPYGLGEVKDIAGLLQAWIRDEDDSRYLGKSGFMGKEWDAGVPGPRYWREVLRVMKPGAHILCFASTRTVDLMMIALRLAGFQCRDTLMWVYGQGFPKSTDISKKIDKMQGAEREIVGPKIRLGDKKPYPHNPTPGNEWNERYGLKTWRDPETAPATPEARQHAGTGTALKPAHEPIILARKPLSEKSIAANVLKWGTGGLNIDACRVSWEPGGMDGQERTSPRISPNPMDWGKGKIEPRDYKPKTQGRFPSNLLLSHSWLCTDDLCDEQCPILALDLQSGIRKSKAAPRGGTSPNPMSWGNPRADGDKMAGYTDQGGASRYFSQFCYTAKASRSERNRGCEGLPTDRPDAHNLSSNACGRCGLRVKANGSGKKCECGDLRETIKLPPALNGHPTVKPLTLMSWLCRLITPPGGTVLDCFAGSGSTLVACVQEGLHFIGIEAEADYCAIARARLAYVMSISAERD